ncbi:hypothetical protein JNB91_18015 [Rhizobium wenxiniae]|uniref:hypothetical protein n=1 Tax=Rhizobium wenxiniae TaxID=1737357 RepID=UPI001C6F0007|nr:hypothetical protein [Rhizobium wenxiniae]MBW9089719.1 hypothetical protein [Rhizobium wenxiniae]
MFAHIASKYDRRLLSTDCGAIAIFMPMPFFQISSMPASSTEICWHTIYTDICKPETLNIVLTATSDQHDISYHRGRMRGRRRKQKQGMFAQLNLYAIIALFIALIALGGGWYVSHRISTAEIDTLTQRNAVLTNAVETNERTIATIIADAAPLAATNQKLTHSIIATEMEQAASWNAIDALDLATDSDDAGIEKQANYAFAASISALRAASSN